MRMQLRRSLVLRLELVIALVLALSLSVPVLTGWAQESGAAAFTVSSANGNVVIKRANGSSEMATTGTVLFANDQIASVGRSEAMLTGGGQGASSGASLLIYSDTTLGIRNPGAGAGGFYVADIAQGVVLARSAPGSSSTIQITNETAGAVAQLNPGGGMAVASDVGTGTIAVACDDRTSQVFFPYTDMRVPCESNVVRTLSNQRTIDDFRADSNSPVTSAVQAAGTNVATEQQQRNDHQVSRTKQGDEDDSCPNPNGQIDPPGGFWEAVALLGAGAAPGHVGALLSPGLMLALGRSRRRVRMAGRSYRRFRAPVSVVMLSLLMAVSSIVPTQVANAAAFNQGDVLVAVGNGQVDRYSPSGTFIETLNTGSGSQFTTGMCFDQAGSLYVTNFSTSTLSKFDNQGRLLQASVDGPFSASPESCVVDGSGNVYIGQASGTADIVKLNSSGSRVATFDAATERRGTDWIDLAADQCTMFYTSEGNLIKRFNVCTNAQLADFARLPTSPAFALRIRSNGEVLVAAETAMYRVSASGTVSQTYSGSSCGLAGEIFALNLDPDGTSFWTADLGGNNKVCRFDIASGRLLSSFTTRSGTNPAGLAIVGEIRVALPPPVAVSPSPQPGDVTVRRGC